MAKKIIYLGYTGNNNKLQFTDASHKLSRTVKAVNELIDKDNDRNDALAQITDVYNIVKDLELDNKVFAKLNILAKAHNTSVKDAFNTVISKMMNDLSSITDAKSGDNKETKTTGNAYLKIESFVNAVKEHNNNSEFKIKLSQTSIQTGLYGKDKRRKDSKKGIQRTVNSDVLKCDSKDKELLIYGTGVYRNIVSDYIDLNGTKIEKYNASLNDLSVRKSNIAIVKELTEKQK